MYLNECDTRRSWVIQTGLRHHTRLAVHDTLHPSIGNESMREHRRLGRSHEGKDGPHSVAVWNEFASIFNGMI